jgi:3-oxoacyl-[acyl-carrier protein] reductase
VAPGVTDTDMAAPMREHLHDALMRRLLVKRFAEPDEVARAVVYLAGAGRHALAGETLHVDGGMKMA